MMKMAQAGVLDAKDDLEGLLKRTLELLAEMESLQAEMEAAQLRARIGMTLALLQRDDEASEHLERALSAQENGQLEGAAALSRCWLAMLDNSNLVGARQELEMRGARMPAHGRLRSWSELARRSEDPTDLARARQELSYLLEHAPQAWREDMVQHVPAYQRLHEDSSPS